MKIKGVFDQFFSIMSPFLMGIFISYLLYVPCKKLEIIYSKSNSIFITKAARKLSVFSVYLLLILIIVIIIKFATPILYSNIIDLATNVPIYVNNIIEGINDIPDNSFLGDLDIKEGLKEGLIEFSNTHLAKFLNFDNIRQYAESAVGVITSLFNVIISIVFSIYILLERKDILKFLSRLCRALFKKNIYINIKRYFQKTNEVFFTFIASKGVDSIINMLVITTLLISFNVKYALLLGVIAGLLNLVPFFGSIIACFLISIITIFTGGYAKAITVFILLIVFQQIDANIIEPRLMRKSLKISPLLVISSVMIGGAYFGVMGMFLGVPLVTVVKIMLLDYIDYKEQKI
jgi:Predicted permease